MTFKTRVMKFLSLLAAATLFICSDCKKDCTNGERCKIEPVQGPCEALIYKYYYDPGSKTCKEFLWGGCDGVVPFETMEECEQSCPCRD